MRIGEFTVKTKIRATPIFQWVEAADDAGRNVVLQILQHDITTRKVNRTREYFSRLIALRHPLLLTPEELVSDDAMSLVVCYPQVTSQPLTEALATAPEQFARWSRQAAEALTVLHEHDLRHGCVSPLAFVVIGDNLALTDFGYERLLGLGDADTLALYKDFIAPETRRDSTVSAATDLYGYARTLAYCRPEVQDIRWYSTATKPKPGDRYPTVHQAFEQLTVAFPAIGIVSEAEASRRLRRPPDPEVSLPEPLEAIKPSAEVSMPVPMPLPIDTMRAPDPTVSLPEPMEAETLPETEGVAIDPFDTRATPQTVVSLPEPMEAETPHQDDESVEEGDNTDATQSTVDGKQHGGDRVDPWQTSNERAAKTFRIMAAITVAVLVLMGLLISWLVGHTR